MYLPWPDEHLDLAKPIKEKFNFIDIFLTSELSGKGGARTFLASPEGDHGIPKQLVLKFGKAAVLEDELKKTTQAVNYFSNCHYVRLLVKSDDGSKACMVMEVAGDGSAKTLADFFRSCSDNTQIEEILDRL